MPEDLNANTNCLSQNDPPAVAPFFGIDCFDACYIASGANCYCFGAPKPAPSANRDPETFVDSAGDTIKKYVDVGIGTSIYSNTIGVLWSAATGTVNADAKAILIHDQMVAQMQASNFTATWSSLYRQATSDVTTVLVQAKADPSQASIGNNPGLDNLKKWLEIGAGLVVLYLAIELYLDYKGGSK